MDFKNYAGYYIGCRCFNTWFPEDHPTYNAGWFLQGFNGTSKNLYMLENEHDITWTDSIKPILRKLGDMTRDEMMAIWQIIVSRPFPESGNIVWIDKEDRTSCKRWCMMSGVDRVGIEFNGNVWADCDLSHIKFNPHLVSHYLLTQHFDLFGLIDAGLAVDAKTIK